MSIHFHPLRVKEIRRETSACVSIVLDVPDELREGFRFQQGQSLTLRHFIDGEEIRRTYSLCSAPADAEWRVAVKKVEGGVFSTYANEQLKVGDMLEVMPPVGRFHTLLDPKNRKNYIAIAAGSGITPVMSIIKATLAAEPHSRFTLVYGNRSRQDIIFLEELEGLKNVYMDRLQLLHILSREQVESSVLQGRINGEKMAELARFIPLVQMDEFFLCGPEQMIFAVKDFLEANGIDKKKIHFELFTTPGQQVAAGLTKTESKADTPKASIRMRLDGRTIEFQIPQNSEQTILDAALATGADLPYACKGGVCCTCKARLVEGEVHMDVHWGLEEEEIKQGFILTCQSHPRSEKLLVDFDDR